MTAAEALARYRENAKKTGGTAAVHEFNGMSMKDRLELLFHMLHNQGMALEQLLVGTDIPVELHEVTKPQ